MATKPLSSGSPSAPVTSNMFTRSDFAVAAILTFPAWSFALYAVASLFGVEG